MTRDDIEELLRDNKILRGDVRRLCLKSGRQQTRIEELQAVVRIQARELGTQPPTAKELEMMRRESC
jgi:hypothetical protein